MECLLVLEQWDRAVAMLADMIRSCPDQWAYIQQYLGCQMQICKTKWKESLAADKRGARLVDEERAESESEGVEGEEVDDCDGEQVDTWSNYK